MAEVWGGGAGKKADIALRHEGDADSHAGYPHGGFHAAGHEGDVRCDAGPG